MPHLIVEFSDNLTGFPAKQILAELNTAVVASGQVQDETDLKSRTVRTSQFAIGTDRAASRAAARVATSSVPHFSYATAPSSVRAKSSLAAPIR